MKMLNLTYLTKTSISFVILVSPISSTSVIAQMTPATAESMVEEKTTEMTPATPESMVEEKTTEMMPATPESMVEEKSGM